MSELVPNPVEITQELVRCASVTPKEAGALTYLEDLLKAEGFNTQRLIFSGRGSYDVDNLYARFGTGSPHFCFAGHTDVVPIGDESAWTQNPFGGDIINGKLYGRGTEDMKGGVAAALSSALSFLKETPDFAGSISFLITGDEEADSINGTARLVEWLKENGETIDACIVGEPTNDGEMGTQIKNGRRGSLSASLTVEGTQGHVAYPDRNDNPITRAIPLLNALALTPFDNGSASFPPTNLEITSVDVGNQATNVVPAQITAKFNIRFNDHWNAESLKVEIENRLKKAAREGTRFELKVVKPVSDVFLTEAPDLIHPLQAAINEVTGKTAALSTGGGTSDARFIKDHCPVVEFGLVYNSLHQVDEHTPIADIHTLSHIYLQFLRNFFH